jgi:hypothetical protein
MSMEVSGGGPSAPRLPQGGTFGMSEVVPIIGQHAAAMRQARIEWGQLRDKAAEAKALAKKTRADLIVHLRVWGNESTGVAIKTSAERNEWADADDLVQATELAADLAQGAAMNAKAALDEATALFNTLQSMLGIERDSFKFERGGPSA